MNEKQKRTLRICSKIIFGVYLVLLIYMLFFAESMGRTFTERTYHYNLVPFKEIKRFLVHWESLGTMAVMLNLFGNVAAFVPYGLILPIMYRRLRSLGRITLWTFEFSLLVEVLQLVSKVGSFDVDDLLLNTLGGILGYLGFVILDWIRRKRDGKTS